MTGQGDAFDFRSPDVAEEPASQPEAAPLAPGGGTKLGGTSGGLEASLYGSDLFGAPVIMQKLGPMNQRFLIPPFSVFNAAGGFWQERKSAWLSIGIKSEVGRDGNLLQFSDVCNATMEGVAAKDYWKQQREEEKEKGVRLEPGGGGGGAWLGGRKTESSDKYGREEEEGGSGTSIFDPVLCELMYRWFVPAGGRVLDPFAGGSVRGIVAAKLGLRYCGVELREVQVVANRRQAAELVAEGEPMPEWVQGDSMTVLEPQLGGGVPDEIDFVFTCPPYGDLERYIDDPADLSTMEYHTFMAAMKRIIMRATRRLAPNRFAAIVVGDFRDKKTGFYRNFVADTISAFTDCGLGLYNEAILVTARGSLPIRAGKQFAAGRKFGKTHQNILVFCKGDGLEAARACPAL